MDRPCRGVLILGRLRFVDSTGSTNADLLRDPAAAEGDWLIAREQTAGKGRQGRSWSSRAGNFHGSVLLGLQPGDPAPSSLSLAAALALVDAFDATLPGHEVQIKWPNDLLLDGGKLSGILLERNGDRVVIGFGVNLAAAPEIPGRRAESLAPLGRLTPEGLAPVLAASVARRVGQWRRGDGTLLTDWMRRAHPVGSRLTVHGADGEPVSGGFEGLEPDGALRLRVGEQVRTVHAGDVSLG